MIHGDPDELSNREVDGENTPEESAALQARLDRDRALRTRHERLFSLVEALRNVTAADPPIELTAAVLGAIRGRPKPYVRRSGWIEAVNSAFERATRPRAFLTFASGLAAGALVTALLAPSLSLPRLDKAEMAGSILPASRLEAVVDSQRLDVDGGSIEVSIRRGKDVVRAEIEIDSPKALDLTVDFDSAAFTALAFERSGEMRGDAVLGDGHVSLRQAAGAGRYTLVLGVRDGSRPSVLRLKVAADASSLERILETRREATNFPDR